MLRNRPEPLHIETLKAVPRSCEDCTHRRAVMQLSTVDAFLANLLPDFGNRCLRLDCGRWSTI